MLGQGQGYGPLEVLQSAAGWYLGTMYTHGKDSDHPGMIEPGSRESEYFPTHTAAQAAMDNQTWQQRTHP